MTAAHIIQRPLRGSRISTFYPIKNLPSLSSLDSAFQLQEYISLLIRLDVHDVDSIVSLPGTSKKDRDVVAQQDPAEVPKDDDKENDRKSDVQVDQACWIYEQLRRLAQDLSHPLITTLQQECSRATCPEMKAGEWLYLCVAHGNDGAMEQCCAIDYILHTVDSATALLNSPRTFPSRLQIPQTSHRHFASLARRLGRIFAHAYYSHREIFEQAEAESSLYARFLALTSKFELVPIEFLVIPSGQYGGEGEKDHSRDGHDHYPPRQQQPDHNPQTSMAPKVHQHQFEVGRSRSPLVSVSSHPSSISTGGIGEHPTTTNGSRSRFGRNRTDTMVFADIEYSGVADELAAKARAGEFDTNYELEAPKSARLITQTFTNEQSREEETEDIDPESEAHFEIPLDEELNPEPAGLEILNVEVERKEAEPLIPESEEEPGILAADSIDSATMDEHIQATISEDVDEPEIPGVPDDDAEPDLSQIESGIEPVSVEELETFVPLISGDSPTTNAPSSPPPGDLSSPENEPVVGPVPVQPPSDDSAQGNLECEGDTSAAIPEILDAEEVRTLVQVLLQPLRVEQAQSTS